MTLKFEEGAVAAGGLELEAGDRLMLRRWR